MRFGIIGSRGFTDAAIVHSTLNRIISNSGEDVIVCSSGKGSDETVHAWAKTNLVDAVTFRPYNFVDRKVPHRPNYFYFCNKQIIDNSDSVIIFYDGKEKCALAAYEYAVSKNIEVSAFIDSSIEG